MLYFLDWGALPWAWLTAITGHKMSRLCPATKFPLYHCPNKQKPWDSSARSYSHWVTSCDFADSTIFFDWFFFVWWGCHAPVIFMAHSCFDKNARNPFHEWVIFYCRGLLGSCNPVRIYRGLNGTEFQCIKV